MLTTLLLALVSIAEAQITINIIVNENVENTTIDLLGSIADPISDIEQKIFKLFDTEVKQAVYELVQKQPIKVKFVKEDNDDKTRPVTRTLIAKSAKIVQSTSKKEILKQEEIINREREKITTNYTFTIELDEGISNKFHTTDHFTLGQGIEHNVDLTSATNGDGYSFFSYTTGWGEDKSQNVKVPVRGPLLRIPLGRGDGITVKFTANRVSMDIEVTYEARLEGHVFCSFNENYDDEPVDVNALLRVMRVPTVITSTEIIHIQFHANALTAVSHKINIKKHKRDKASDDMDSTSVESESETLSLE